MERLERLLGAVVVAASCAAVMLAPATATAATRHAAAAPLPVTPGSGYLALGDSVTFGYMESGVVPSPNYHNAASFPGYPEQLGAELHLQVANAACPGETSSSLVKASAISNGCESTLGKPVGYRRSYPLHVKYKGSQLAYALTYLQSHTNVRLVSLMIGANDYFACVSTTSDGCARASEQKTVLGTISKNVKTILSDVRTKAHYSGQLAIVNYYSLNYASAATNALSLKLNRTLDTAAKPFHVTIADGYGEFEAQANKFGDSPCDAGLLTQLGMPGTCGIHPSYAGQALLAQALEKAITL
jgi:lysophospholipase L1-like esterase